MSMMVNPFVFGAAGNPYGLVGVGTTVEQLGTTNDINLPYPSGIKANDILVAHITITSGTAPSHVVPSGWNLLLEATLGSDNAYRHYVFWKRAAGSESGTQAFNISTTGSSSIRVGTMSAWGGCVTTGTPFDGAVSNRDTSASATSSASLTTSQANEIVVNCIGVDGNVSATPPGGYTEIADYGTASGFDAAESINYTTVVSAGAVAASTTTLSVSKRWGVISFGLKR